MRFQVSCAPTHAKFLVDSNLNKSVPINLIIKTTMGNAWRSQAASPLDCYPPPPCTRFKALESRLGAEAKQEDKVPEPTCGEELWEAATWSYKKYLCAIKVIFNFYL